MNICATKIAAHFLLFIRIEVQICSLRAVRAYFNTVKRAIIGAATRFEPSEEFHHIFAIFRSILANKHVINV